MKLINGFILTNGLVTPLTNKTYPKCDPICQVGWLLGSDHPRTWRIRGSLAHGARNRSPFRIGLFPFQMAFSNGGDPITPLSKSWKPILQVAIYNQAAWICTTSATWCYSPLAADSRHCHPSHPNAIPGVDGVRQFRWGWPLESSGGRLFFSSGYTYGIYNTEHLWRVWVLVGLLIKCNPLRSFATFLVC